MIIKNSHTDLKTLILIGSLLISIGGAWALVGNRATANEAKIKEIEEKYVTKEVLDLHLEPIKKDVNETKEAIKRVEKTSWEILQELKQQNGVHGR